MTMLRKFRAAGVVAALIAGLALSARASKPNATDSLASGAAVPGSQQDFVVNVGDRVFFETDQTELSAQARATLDKQAQWLQQYGKYSFTIDGHADERGTREYNIALGMSATISLRAASSRTACAPSHTARSARSRSATTFRAGRKTAAL